MWIKKAVLGRDTLIRPKEIIQKDQIEVDDIVRFLEQEKGQNITVLALGDTCPFADHMIILEAISPRHLVGLAESLLKHSKTLCPKKAKTFEIEGKESKNWIIVSIDKIMVHLFMPETRQLYQLEDLRKSILQRDKSRDVALEEVLAYLKQRYQQSKKEDVDKTKEEGQTGPAT
jgi:ribosome-associated protein